jgi:hypothetical protein
VSRAPCIGMFKPIYIALPDLIGFYGTAMTTI